MFENKNLLQSLKSISTESFDDMLKETPVSPYINMECREELEELDALEMQDIALESYIEFLLGYNLLPQEIGMDIHGMESLDVEFMKANGINLSNEAVSEKLKAGWETVKSAFATVAAKIVQGFIAVVDFFQTLFGGAGRMKKYGKLIEKYNKVLSERTAKDDTTNMKYTDFSALSKRVKDWKDSAKVAASSKLADAFALTEGTVPSIATAESNLGKVVTALGTSVVGQNMFGKENVTAIAGLLTPAGDTSAATEKVKAIQGDIKKNIAKYGKELSTYTDTDATWTAIKDNLSKTATELVAACSEDVVFNKEYRQLQSKAKAYIKAIKAAENEDAAKFKETIKGLNTVVGLIAQYRTGLTKTYGALSGSIGKFANQLGKHARAGVKAAGAK